MTPDQQSQVNVMLHDMANVLGFDGWVHLHGLVMSGQFLDCLTAPQEAPRTIGGHSDAARPPSVDPGAI